MSFIFLSSCIVYDGKERHYNVKGSKEIKFTIKSPPSRDSITVAEVVNIINKNSFVAKIYEEGSSYSEIGLIDGVDTTGMVDGNKFSTDKILVRNGTFSYSVSGDIRKTVPRYYISNKKMNRKKVKEGIREEKVSIEYGDLIDKELVKEETSSDYAVNMIAATAFGLPLVTLFYPLCALANFTLTGCNYGIVPFYYEKERQTVVEKNVMFLDGKRLDIGFSSPDNEMLNDNSNDFNKKLQEKVGEHIKLYNESIIKVDIQNHQYDKAIDKLLFKK
ncbi:MAG: hypothetical protein LBC92_00105 [Rickettsiales bacterium]|nr:hypothetical protein [Rickettsiales bacterium]